MAPAATAVNAAENLHGDGYFIFEKKVVCVCVYIYIYREREREREAYSYI
jgi:hypothetical protein